jgi:cytochrome c oxidase subunit I
VTTIKPGGERLTRPLAPVRSRRKGTVIAAWLSSTGHKGIGYMYLITSFLLFALAGVMALVIRAEPAQPGVQVVTQEAYNQLFTMHGTIMMLLFATPLFAGFANVIMPLRIGAPDVAFPRLNAVSCRVHARDSDRPDRDEDEGGVDEKAP